METLESFTGAAEVGGRIAERVLPEHQTCNLLLKQNDNLKWEIFDFNYEYQNIESDEKP